MDKLLKRFNELYKYNPQKGILNEGWDDVDTSNYICVGEVPFYPWADGKDKVYIMVNPQKTMEYGEEINDVRYTENPDGSGKQIDNIPPYGNRFLTIYPEHQNDEFGEMFLGKRKSDDTVKQQHELFLSKLFRRGNKVIIHHNSSYKVTDGVIKKGVQNTWSNNSDIGIYFWGNRSGGKDPSNVGQYTYYCIIPINELYDFDTNEERISLDQALKKYKYAGQTWQHTDSIVVSTLQETPIWCILDKSNGKWYDRNWNEISNPL